MKTNLRERSTRYQCFIRPKVHCSPEFSFNEQSTNKSKQVTPLDCSRGHGKQIPIYRTKCDTENTSKFCVYNMLVFISRDRSLNQAQRFLKKEFHVTMWWWRKAARCILSFLNL